MFYVSIWDPKLIIFQIIALQSCFYVSLGAYLWVFHYLAGQPVTLSLLFHPRSLNFDSLSGGLAILASFFNSFTGSVLLMFIVERSKKCLDFSATVYLFHFAICLMATRHFPGTWTWWLTQVLCMAIMAVIGEYLCMRRELREIPLHTKREPILPV